MGELRMGLRFRHLALLLAAACAMPRGPGGAITVIDDARDTVRLAHPARRIVSLIPASTELLFAIGAGPGLVGRSQWDSFPAAAIAVPSVGQGITPNIEAIIAQHPDLVVLYQSGSNTPAAKRLRALGIAVVQLRTDLLESVGDHARLLGDLTGTRPQADSVADAFETNLAAATVPLSEVAARATRPSILIVTWDEPPITVGSGSFLDELVSRAGAVNTFHDLQQPSATVSLEAIAQRDPDLILAGRVSDPAFAGRPEWRVVRAVRERRFVRVAGTEFNYPGPRSPQAIRDLRAALLAAQRR
jgi:ABC-type Fe3+-hydroxamate transport system substrate-binding protein